MTEPLSFRVSNPVSSLVPVLSPMARVRAYVQSNWSDVSEEEYDSWLTGYQIISKARRELGISD